MLALVKVLSCDDHDLFRSGLRQVLEEMDETELLEAGTGEEALRIAAEHDDLDLALIDLGLPDTDGLSLLATLRERHPLVAVAVLSGSEDPAGMRAALDAGAVGFIPKSSKRPVLLSALQLIQAGGVYVPAEILAAEAPAARATPASSVAAKLTPRQREVLDLVSKGLTNKEICGVLGIAEGTVKGHLAALFEILDVTNRTEAVRAMVDLGLVVREE